jgi:hypothetical protein
MMALMTRSSRICCYYIRFWLSCLLQIEMERFLMVCGLEQPGHDHRKV